MMRRYIRVGVIFVIVIVGVVIGTDDVRAVPSHMVANRAYQGGADIPPHLGNRLLVSIRSGTQEAREWLCYIENADGGNHVELAREADLQRCRELGIYDTFSPSFSMRANYRETEEDMQITYSFSNRRIALEGYLNYTENDSGFRYYLGRWLTWLPDESGLLAWNGLDHEIRLYTAPTWNMTTVETFPSQHVRDEPFINNGLRMEVSADSSMILLHLGEDSANDLYVLGIDSADVTQLTDSTGDEGICARWSPVSNEVAFDYLTPTIVTIVATSANARIGPGTSYAVATTFPYGTELPLLGRRTGWVQTMTADGREVWVSDTLVDITLGVSTVELVDSDGSNRHTLAEGREPVWSPDGQSIAYVCGSKGMCLIDLASGDIQELTSIETRYGTVSQPYWGPNGNQLAFIAIHRESGDEPPTFALHIYDLVTNEDHILLSHQGAFIAACGADFADIQWSPDGEWLLYHASSPDPEGRSNFSGPRSYHACNIEGCRVVGEQASGSPYVRWWPLEP